MKDLTSRFKGFDLGLILPAVLLISFGIVVILSTSPSLAQEQLVFAIVGLVSFVLISLTDPVYFKWLAPHGYVIALILLTVTDVLGIVSRGAVRWLPLGWTGLTLQASEVSKVFLILSLAHFFSLNRWGSGGRAFLYSLMIVAVPAALVYWQPDLGTALIFFIIWAVLLLAAPVKARYLLFLALVFFLSLPFWWTLLKPYQRERVGAFLNPNLDPLGSGYHILQSRIAIGSGLIFGRGFGQGTQSHLRFLPEYHNDFIFATLAEEWGLTGTLILVSFYAAMLLRILHLSLEAKESFERFICLGVFAMFFSQFVINVGMNLGLAPVTGIPLPLVSSGGSSLVTSLASLALVQSVARGQRFG